MLSDDAVHGGSRLLSKYRFTRDLKTNKCVLYDGLNIVHKIRDVERQLGIKLVQIKMKH